MTKSYYVKEFQSIAEDFALRGGVKTSRDLSDAGCYVMSACKRAINGETKEARARAVQELVAQITATLDER